MFIPPIQQGLIGRAAALLALSLFGAVGVAQSPASAPTDTAYLFSYFLGNGEDGLHLAWSRDGLKWQALNDGRSCLKPKVGKSKLMRDPCIVQGPDGTFHMVWTDSWDSRTIGYASSKDLIGWSPQKAIPVMEHEPSTKNCWAPEVVYDPARECFMIFWASTLPGRFPETWFDGRNDNNHRIYATTTRDFQSFTPTGLFFDPGFNTIDSTLLASDGKVYMVFKDETKHPTPMKNLRLAVADQFAGPYQVKPDPINPPGAWVEGPTTLRIGEDIYLYFDVYTQHRYAGLRSRDLVNWEDISSDLVFPKGTRHGTAFEVSGSVLRALLDVTKDSAARIVVDTAEAGVPVSPAMHGVFFEDINYAADGGLYAELVQNRSFEHGDPLYSWTEVNQGAQAGMRITSVGALSLQNSQFLRLDIRVAGDGFGVANSGFNGIPVQKDADYLFSVHARGDMGFRGGLQVRLEDEQGHELGQCRIRRIRGEWKQYEATLKARRGAANARLVVLATDEGRLDLDMISLFPKSTWKQRRNGLRADLVQLLADMKPGFMRFPGGCIVEGKDLANAYRWKDTVGDVAQRPQNWNRWQDAVATKAPHYYQSYGLGFFEYFQLCEDIGAEPIPIVNCGMSCQYQDKEQVPLAELEPWVQDALDLVEFANGAADTPWGAVRAEMGHPEPFNLRYLGVGNEQWGEAYFERYQVFYDALKAEHPGITLITTSGPGADGQSWRLAWDKFAAGTPAEIVDEHYYRPPQWFLDNADRYDSYSREGPKVFAGEFAAHDPDRANNLRCALAEAAFMTGLLRNAEVVVMASYAPLLAREGFTQWRPDLIWFDGTRAYGSPSYHVQSMFSRNRPDVVLPLHLRQPASTPWVASGGVGVGTWNTQAEFKDLRVTRNGETLFESDFASGLDGWTTSRGSWEVTEGALRQTREQTDVRAWVGDPDWSDYTYSLKARKLGGREGFLILFQVPSVGTRCWWNLGGWGNTAHALQGPGLPETRVDGRIETGRWYDVRIELKGASVRCYLDGQLLQSAERRIAPSLYSVAGRDVRSGELILAMVNPSEVSVRTGVELSGWTSSGGDAVATVLTSDSPEDANSLAHPNKVVPREERVTLEGPGFERDLPPHSFTLLRVKPGRRL